LSLLAATSRAALAGREVHGVVLVAVLSKESRRVRAEEEEGSLLSTIVAAEGGFSGWKSCGR
jgi:hypothetical protein